MPQITYWKVLTRRKTLSLDNDGETKLNRVLGTYDLTALGVGATLGVGVYVLAGHVARDQAGPSVVLSFFIAAVASLLAGLCYAEFGARVPKAGSAYIYSYVCIGEFAAFIIGWNLILEYIIGSASVCRGISLYLDTLVNNTIKTTFNEIAPIEWGFLGTYFDFFAFGLAITFGFSLAFGIRTSTFLNNFCTVINVGIVIFVIIAGAINADIHNWQINPLEVNITSIEKPVKLGVGGFFPFGFEGTLRGAATCFFGFVGFDCIATTGEEVKDPRRAIPRAILFSLFVIFLSYFGVSTVLTLMWPYYLQDVDAPLPYAFEQIGWPVAKWIVTIGGMLGLVASLFGALFPLPRIIYAMSQDGLVFRFLGIINPRFKTPIIGSVCAAVLTGIIAGIFDLTQLVNMLSIGTLLAYTVIAICLTILRFMDNSYSASSNNRKNELTEESNLMSNHKRKTCTTILMQVFNFKRISIPSELSTALVCVMLIVYCLSSLAFSLTIMYATNEILIFEPWALALLGIFGSINLLIVLAISVQPREDENPYFKVPLVPLLPGISIFVNIYLMLQLDIYTWIRFGIWMVIGLNIYLPCICLYNRTNNEQIPKSYLSQNWGIINEGFENEDGKNNKINGIGQLNGTKIIVKNELDENSEESIQSNTTSPKQSLDEIVYESELSESMKEMKYSNGKTFFIEQNSPTLEKEQNNIEIDGDDAKSVLQILDNVLMEEESVIFDMNRKTSVDSELIPSFVDISTAAMVHRSNSCFKEEDEEETKVNSEDELNFITDRNISLQIEKNRNASPLEYNENLNISQPDEITNSTTNVPLLLNKENEISSNLLDDTKSEKDFHVNIKEDLIPGTNIQIVYTPRNSDSTKISNSDLKTLLETNLEPTVIPKEHPNINNKNEDAIPNYTINAMKDLSSSELQKNQKNTPTTTPRSSRKVNRTIVPLKTGSPPSSPESTSSIKNPMHSEDFKEKLSRLMTQPPPTSLKIKMPPKENSEELPKHPKTAPADIQPNPLKLSKSDVDIRQLVLRAIEKQNHDNLNDITSKEDSIENNNIPKPPKFDPILYKSLGAKTYNQTKERPKLDELVNSKSIDENPKLSEVIKSPITPAILSNDKQTEPPVPFKEKLAALIKRGPSYKIQRQLPPDISSPRNSLKPRNFNNDNNNNYADVLQAIRDAKKSNTKNISGQDNANVAVEIENVRKSLKPLVE